MALREQDLERFRKVALLLDLLNHIHFTLQLSSSLGKGFLLAALTTAASAEGQLGAAIITKVWTDTACGKVLKLTLLPTLKAPGDLVRNLHLEEVGDHKVLKCVMIPSQHEDREDREEDA